MARWVEFTISKQGHKAFVNLDEALIVRQAPASEPGTTLIELNGGKVSVMESVAEVMTVINGPSRG